MRPVRFCLAVTIAVLLSADATAQCQISPSSLQDTTVGTDYRTQFTGSDLLATYTFKEDSALPPGLSLSSTGLLSGSPTSAGQFGFKMYVKGTRALLLTVCEGTNNYTLVVTECATSTLTSPSDRATVPAGSPVTFSWTPAGNPTSFDHEISADGKTWTRRTTKTADVTVSLEPGAYQWKVRTYSSGCEPVESAVFTLTVSSAASCSLSLTPSSLPGGTVGANYEALVSASGGTEPYEYVVTAGSLPNGLSLDRVKGTITGTPAVAGTNQFTITATDANRCSVSAGYTIDVSAPPCGTITVDPPALEKGTAGTPYNAMVSAKGGTSPYSYSLSGSLPDGVLLDPVKGTISGTPTTPGTYRFTITSTDANQCSGSTTYSLEIACPAIAISPSALPDGTIGAGYLVTLAGNGGTAPYSYTLAGALPDGLSLKGDQLSGTPTKPGIFSFTITALDKNSCAGSTSYSMRVVCPAIAIEPAALPNATIGSAYRATLAATGGTTPYSYALQSGALPDGLTLNGADIIGTPEKAGSYTFTIAATDVNGCSGSKTYSIEVGCPAIAIGPAALPNATIGSAYRATLAATGGTTPYSYALQSGALPDGLTLNGADISGTAARAGSYTFTIAATDAGGCSESKTYSIEAVAAECPAISVNPSTLPGGTVGSIYGAPLAAGGGAAPYSYAVTSGTLPAGLTLSGDSLSGTPTSAGSYAFTITATDANRCSGSRPYEVEIVAACPKTTARPVTPAPGASVAGSVSFSWSAAEGAAGYDVLLSNDGGATFTVVASTTGTSASATLPSGNYSWAVRARFDAKCDPTLSASSAFSVIAAAGCPTDLPTLLSPVNGATMVAAEVTFTWSPVAGAVTYVLHLSIDGAPPQVVATTSATSHRHLFSSPGRVSWQVEAQFSSCAAVRSVPSTLTLTQPSSECDANRAPALQFPLGAATTPVTVTSPVDLRWIATPGASAYRVWVSMNGSAPADVAVTKETSLRLPLPGGSYSWFVEADFPGCRSLSTQQGFFEVPPTDRCGTSAPFVIAPANGAGNVPASVTFLWSPVADAIEYRVYAARDSGFLLIGTTSDPTLTRVLPPGTITWYVEAVFRACPSTESSHARFTIVESASCAEDRPATVSPAAGAQALESPVDFAWTPVAGAVSYVVLARTEAGTATVVGETAGTTLTRHMPPGETIEWSVVALRSGCAPIASPPSSFSVAAPPDCEARPPMLHAPAEAARVTSPVRLSWTPSAGATGYRVWAVSNLGQPVMIAAPASNAAQVTLPQGIVEWFVEARFASCLPLRSSSRMFFVLPASTVCRAPEQPEISVVGQVLSGTPYTLRWGALAAVDTYEVQESSSRLDFSSATTIPVAQAVAKSFTYETASPVQKFYRVRGISSCSSERGPYSEVVGIHIVPLNARQQQTPGTIEIGLQQSVVQTVFIAGGAQPVPFTARTDRRWLNVSPSSGILPVDGMSLTVTADPRALDLGANTGTLLLTYGSQGGRMTTHAQPVNVPVSISLVTPVVPGGKNTPPAESLIIPAVGHAPGANNSLFQSDVRVANTSSQPLTYMLNFTPSGTDATLSGSSTTIQVPPGGMTALNDILASFFGTGPGGIAIGTLEIRPMTSNASSSALATPLTTATIASSRTYNVTAGGTLGQYVPAIPFSRFVGRAADGSRTILSLQQIAESPAYRTNLGLVEGSGQPADVLIRIFDNAGRAVANLTQSLRPGEHKQINSVLASAGIQLDDARIEVEVTSATGRITAYASRVDNITNDPLLVQPVVKGQTQSTRYIVPGVAYADGNAKWRSDVRIFNAAETATEAVVTYFPQGNPGAAITKPVTLEAGAVVALDNVLHTFFGINEANASGSLLVSTPGPSSLVATARTYAVAEAGTYGLFAPGVTPEEAVGAGERSLHLLQLEHSDEYRTNVGLVETAGKAVSVEVSLILPDSKVTPKVRIDLAANGFLQFPLSAFNVGDAVYNSRLTVKVLSGSGRVSAYGSVVDNRTNDATYVPAQ